MKKKLVIVGVLLAMFVLADSLFHLTHGEGWWAQIPAFFAFLGFVGGLLIFFLAKIVISALLHRNEDYYESDRNNQ
ncbi:MAG: hypothetical protein WCS74_03035 [Dehalococcoidales bacterium]|nr:hypothetical protein [Dehalococcoidales bacterium]MDD3264580.1 hypothetical protein [Dehalococcoidales bacterium]MDD4322222.1 hypothetical protein [Dehalococcoidales bacterium]MDD4793802.1 hypothetical protein [Dehalococcoidales bacterium]MDD5122272.1 hypothetical protein [Dehalococcoidales bacterium]